MSLYDISQAASVGFRSLYLLIDYLRFANVYNNTVNVGKQVCNGSTHGEDFSNPRVSFVLHKKQYSDERHALMCCIVLKAGKH